MSSKPRLLAFSGSTRKESFNQKLAAIGASAAEQAGAEVELLSLAEFPMPLYDGDLEAESGIPENAKLLKEKCKASSGFLISSPEYNSSYSAVLKNTIDWISRPEEGEPRLAAFTGKTAALLAASPGALGGLRGLYQLRWLLSNIMVHVIPQQATVSNAGSAFAGDGSLKDADTQKKIEGVARQLVEVAGKLG